MYKVIKCYNCGIWRATTAKKSVICFNCNKNISFKKAYVKLFDDAQEAVNAVKCLNLVKK
jgi:hypothetical protein